LIKKKKKKGENYKQVVHKTETMMVQNI